MRNAGAHYVDYLDPVEAPESRPARELTDRDRDYYRLTQHHRAERNEHHVAVVESFLPLSGARVLDVGCGGGFFLWRAQSIGADATGIDPSPAAVRYAREELGVKALNLVAEDPDWRSANHGAYDVVTLWDVIEHVNSPRDTLVASTDMLRRGGYLFVGTPCRDTFYHRTGMLTGRLTGGRYPTFLNQMYSSEPFGHKQILSVLDLARLFELAGIELLRVELLHELSLPYKHYLEKMTRSKRIATMLAPFVKAMFSVARIKNKMIAVGRKP